MRAYNFFIIVLLCLFILLVDTAAYYWLQSILELIPYPFFVTLIKILFWVFTFALIIAILSLKLSLSYIDPSRRQRLISSMYGLTVSSFIPKIIFVIVISTLYYSNYVFSEDDSLIWIPIAGLIAGFLPFFVIVYATLKGLYRFKVYNINLQNEQLKGVRIVQISDLHLGSFRSQYKVFDRAIKMINDLEPDLIFFTGDLVNNYAWELKGWEESFKKLRAKQGKFSILGNHDYGDYSTWENETDKEKNFEAIKDFQTRIGFRLLLNESEIVIVNSNEVAIIGVENWGKPPFNQYGDLEKALKTVREIPSKILLSHDPSHWKEEVLSHPDIFLTLSGHTHGMQAGFSVGGKQWSPIKYKYKEWAGLYEQRGQYLYVNRGLGWMGFPGRFGMRPEITCIDFE
ncbi:metallophosphoesterase [Aequorivita sp. H23M31]|uniref:Metallophosphoesterase n=1 Tax=Aequorivita ciconiae TaxID=2494375 RepID=A0A410G6X5_9FLAO|nr:metallophosphoesterase [Aequorivita sp. H23M31]QAA82971.1 metallophosphoesterase [Aequorivita sp. H23M31]